MNYEKLKGKEGAVVRIMPPACHLNDAGEVENWPNETWTINAVERDSVTIRTEAGHTFTLNSDHVRGYTSGDKPYLTLLVQIFVQGAEVHAIPGPYPGAAVLPRIDRARKARAFFAPELHRAIGRQLAILERCRPNFSMTSHGKPSCPGDTWQSLMPHPTDQLSDAVMFHDLQLGDAQLLAEFKAAVGEIGAILKDWIATGVSLNEYNAWNLLMHKVEHSLRAGMLAAERFCPDVQFDATVPVAGTLRTRVDLALTQAHTQRSAFIEQKTAEMAKVQRRAGR